MGLGFLGLETTPINKFLYYIPISKAEKEGELQQKQRIPGDISL